jgi:hypothetical protein
MENVLEEALLNDYESEHAKYPYPQQAVCAMVRDDPGTCGHGSTTKPTTALRKSKGGDALLTCVAHPQTCDYG